VIDERATEPQRAALLRILTGQDTEPGKTVFNVFASTFENCTIRSLPPSSSRSTSLGEGRAWLCLA